MLQRLGLLASDSGARDSSLWAVPPPRSKALSISQDLSSQCLGEELSTLFCSCCSQI